jgi:hypothetical protein
MMPSANQDSAASMFNLLQAVGNFKVWNVYGQHEIQYTKRRNNKYTCNYMYNFNCTLFYTSSTIRIY